MRPAPVQLFEMRLSHTFILGLLSSFCVAAKPRTDNKFEQYHTKFISGSSPLKLDDTSYEKLTAAPRNYGVAVLLTALEARFGCQLCRDFQPEWDVLGNSWIRGDKKGQARLIVGTLDFADGKGTFQKVGGGSHYCRNTGIVDYLHHPSAHATNGPSLDVLPTDSWS